MRLIDADALIADLLTVDPRYTEMVEWCCNVIRQTPTIEPTDTDLISRADAIETVQNLMANEDEWYQEAFSKALKALPSADAVSREAHYDAVVNRITDMEERGFVPAVRCKDCYHAEDDITHMYCVYFGHKVYGDDYCSNAVERREP